jgi:hypothetical protein
MKSKTWILGTAGPLVLGIMATTAQAAPITASVADFRLASAESSPTEKIASRRCWRHNGRRHCTGFGTPQVYRYRNGGSDYYEHDSNNLTVGSQRWWDQMLRENRLNPGGGRN